MRTRPKHPMNQVTETQIHSVSFLMTLSFTSSPYVAQISRADASSTLLIHTFDRNSARAAFHCPEVSSACKSSISN